MFWTFFSHMGAAIAPFFLIWIVRKIRARLMSRAFYRNFWNRQGLEGLKKIDLLEKGGMPEQINAVEDVFASEAARQAASFCIEHGVFNFLDNNPGASAESISSKFGFSLRHVFAGVEVLLAAGFIERQGSGYAVSRACRVYFFKDSPMFDWTLPPPKISKRQLKVLRRGVSFGAVTKWVAGKATPGWAPGMHRISFPLGFALHETFDLAHTNKVMDVAGGVGSVCIALALRSQQTQYVVLELPGSIKFAEKMIAKFGFSERIKCIGADMFKDKWPIEFDVVIFTNIFHDWDDEKCRILAKNAYGSLRPGGNVILQEALLRDEGTGPLWTAHFSLTMAMIMQGKQFRGKELVAMLSEAGFKNIHIRPLLGYYSAVIGEKP